MRRALLAIVCVTCLLLAAPDDGRKPITISFRDYKLKNGLRVILSEDHSAPTYSIAVTYNAGSRDEKPGRTGFAHLFEHMMFQGSENIGKGEHFLLVFNNGGGMNGTTSADRTNYYQTLPANQLDLGLFLEADRMRSLNISEANLENQRQTVKEERRISYDNRPYGRTFELLLETAYDNFAYKHSTIGSMADLDAATIEDVREFFRIYYAPNNAVLTLVGDFKTEDALARIRKHFEGISSQPSPPPPDMREPEQKEERRKTIEDNFAQLTRLDIAFKVPPGNTPDEIACEMTAQVLGSGRSSRLYQKLVQEKEVAVSASAFEYTRRGPSLLWITVMARPGKVTAEIEKLVYEEIELLQKQPAADWELEKVRMQFRRDRARNILSTLDRAQELGEYTVAFNDPNYLNTFEERLGRVTKEDVQRIARTFLKPANRTVIISVPKKAEGRKQ